MACSTWASDRDLQATLAFSVNVSDRRVLGLLRVFRATDHHLATPAIAALARTESIYKHEKFSDHAPITVEYELTV